MACSTYMNASSVTEQVNHIKSRPNLLLWYTGDEPDGTSDPLNATLIASNLITSLDGGGWSCKRNFFELCGLQAVFFRWTWGRRVPPGLIGS